jgi:hypothetical protein
MPTKKVMRGGRRLIRRGGGGIYIREAAPCHKGMGPKLNFDIETSTKVLFKHF